MMYAIKQEGKHQFLVDLSRNVARGQVTTAQSGHLNGQRAPYGYDKVLVNERGEVVQRVKEGERVARPRSWKFKLALSDDAEKVKVARWLFETYDNFDIGCRTLADRLNERGVPSPTGGAWGMATIREIIKNPTYCGDLAWGRRRMGKYHHVAAGEIRLRTDAPGRSFPNPQEEWITKSGAFPAIVSRELWQRVNRKLSARKTCTSGHKRKNGDGYVLSGLIYCAHCGRRMHGEAGTRRKNGKIYRYHRFICSGYRQSKAVCTHNAIAQDLLVKHLVTKLRNGILKNGKRNALRDRIKARLAAQQNGNPADAKNLRTRIEELDVERERLVRCIRRTPDDGVADALMRELAACRGEQDRLRQELDSLERMTAAVDLDRTAEEIADQVWTLAEGLETDEPARLRELLRRVVARIDLRFEHVRKGNRLECPFLSGTMTLRNEPFLLGLENRGDWT